MAIHKPVLLHEAVENLVLDINGYYVDCTFGRGGHSPAILNVLSQKGHLEAFDRDEEAVLSEAAVALKQDPRFCLHHAAFTEMENVMTQNNKLNKVDGVLLDLGVSSPQLDTPERGFSFLNDGPLDMRMDKQSGVTAEQWLATVTETELIKVLFEYGEERFARRIARAVVETRVEQPIKTTGQLADLIESAIPRKEKHKHPATRSFQAIRIAINEELDHLISILEQSVNVLKPGGHLVVIAFHSLEDRLVKRFMRDQSRGINSDSRLPLREDQMQQGCFEKPGKPWRAGVEEIDANPRARSAVMRVARKR